MSPARDQKRTQSRTRLDTCFTLRRATCKLRPRVVSRCRNPREVHQHVKLSNGSRRPPQPRRLACNCLANFAIQSPLDFEYPLFGRQHLAFIFFKFARRKSLGIDQSLLPLVISRRKMQIRFRNLNVETEHLVIADLERSNPGALSLTLLHRRNNLASLLCDVAQLIELGVIAAADHSGIIDHRGRLFRNSARNQITHVRHLVHLIAQRRKPGRPGLHRRDLRTHARNLFKRSAQRQQISRCYNAQRHAARQTLEVENPLKLPSYFLARHRLPLQLRHRFKPRFYLFDRYFRPQNPASQQTRTHPRRRLVNRRQERCPRVIATRSLYKLQVPRGHLIKDHRVLLLVIRDPIQVLKSRPSRPHRRNHRRVLWLPRANRRRLAQIMNQRPRRGRCLRMLTQPKALKPRHSKMLFEESRRMIRLEQPIIEPCFNGPESIQLARSRHRGREQRHRLRQQHFAWSQDSEFVAQPRFRPLARKLRSAKFAGR